MNGACMSRPLREAAHLTDEQVRATVLGDADAPCWSAAEQALIAAVDALHDRATLSDARIQRRCRRITTMRRFSKSSCSAASIAPCRISRTGWTLPLEANAARFPVS